MRRALAGALVVALLSACGGGGGGSDDDDATSTPTTIGRAGSTRVEDGAPVAIGAPLDSYAVTYRVEQVHGDTVTHSTATVTVVRPFRSRYETRDAAGRLTLAVADFAYAGTRPPRGAATALTAAPAASPHDVRTDLVAGAGTGDVREVVGRRCEVHQFGAPILGGGGDLVAGEDVDACIDAEGLVLEQVVRGTRGVDERWVATEVDTSATLTDADVVLAGVTATPAADGGGSVREMDPATAPPGTFWQLDAPPAGFTRRGRYAVVPPQEASTNDPDTRAQVIAGVSDVFVRGRDVLIVDQGGTLGGVPPFGAHAGSDAADLGEVAKSGEVFRTPTGAEARALLPPGHYVRVLGTLPPEELVAIARQLHPIEGAGITYR